MDIVKYTRPNPAVIVYGLYLYFSSRSYRFASKSLEPVIKRTHVSIWKWVQKYSKLVDRFKVNRHLVKEILVDETMLKINGQDYWLWIASSNNHQVGHFKIPADNVENLKNHFRCWMRPSILFENQKQLRI